MGVKENNKHLGENYCWLGESRKVANSTKKEHNIIIHIKVKYIEIITLFPKKEGCFFSI